MSQKSLLSLAGLASVVIILFILLLSGGNAPSSDSVGDVTTSVPASGGEDIDEEVVEDDAETSSMSFDLTGQNFALSETEIRVPLGTEVTINFESVMGFHDWTVDDFDAATSQVNDGDGVTSVTFVADQVGVFEYYCSVGMHRAAGMVGNLIVE